MASNKISKFGGELGDSPTYPNELRDNGKGIGNLPGYNIAYGTLANDRSGNLSKDDMPTQRLIGE